MLSAAAALSACQILWCTSLLWAAVGAEATAVEYSVWDKKLVVEQTNYKAILKNHDQFQAGNAVKRFKGSALAYVTPWNGKGYDIAKTFRHKFTHISPVWYQLRPSQESRGKFQLAGQHDVDQGWMKALRADGAKVKIVPRVLFELPPQILLTTMFKATAAISRLLQEECIKQGFDGWVLEVWSQWAAYGLHAKAAQREKAHVFLQRLAVALHSATPRLELHLAVPPAVPSVLGSPEFRPADWKTLSKYLDGLSVMTYDYARAGPAPNAPLPWIDGNVDALTYNQALRDKSEKLLIGLNFYGMDFDLSGGGSAMVGHEYLERLKRYRPKLAWNATAKEHSFEYVTDGKGHRVYYPTLASIQMRLDYAEKMGAGVSIWEIGQGLDYFYDLL